MNVYISVYKPKFQNLPKGANENLRDGQLTWFGWIRLAPFGRSRHILFYPFKSGYVLLFFWGCSICLFRSPRFETRKDSIFGEKPSLIPVEPPHLKYPTHQIWYLPPNVWCENQKSGPPYPVNILWNYYSIWFLKKNDIHGSKHKKNGMGHEDCINKNTGKGCRVYHQRTAWTQDSWETLELAVALLLRHSFQAKSSRHSRSCGGWRFLFV